MTARGWRRILLYLYPSELRRQHRREMEELLARERRDRPSNPVRRAWSDIRFVLTDALALRRIGRSRPPKGSPAGSGRENRRRSTWDALLVDGRYALRRLIQTPLFTAVACVFSM